MLLGEIVYVFPGAVSTAPLKAVGGKGYSLIASCAAGLPVPAGIVLAVEFFADWWKVLKASAEWQEFLSASTAEELKRACDKLKKLCPSLELSAACKAALKEGLLKTGGTLFAVRSSSPEEDLDGASFAGGYETVTGVTVERLMAAIRQAFSSCLDYRVAVYKKEHGFDATKPSIAIVIQRQVLSEIAGVGFSIDPISNDYDRAVFNSNWGLGETVVAGMATPDTFVVDKLSHRIILRHTGKKETSIYVTSGGGNTESRDPRHDQLTLTDEQLVELTEMVTKIEGLYGKPVDCEWAYEKGILYLLQARPVTGYVPMLPEMQTAPGGRRRLYLDITISVQGIFKPLSPMGTSLLARLFGDLTTALAGQDLTSDLENCIPTIRGGRIWLNLSNVFELIDQYKLADALEVMDPLAASVIRSVNQEAYRSNNSSLKTLPGTLIKRNVDKVLRLVQSRFYSRGRRRAIEAALSDTLVQMRRIAQLNLPLPRLYEELRACVFELLFQQVIPGFLASKLAMTHLRESLPGADKVLVDKLDQALPGNVTVEMGFALYDLARLLPDSSPPSSGRELDSRRLPPEFMKQWDGFMNLYGHRGPVELDIASPRYRDDSSMLINLLREIRQSGKDPRQRYLQNQNERKKAYETLRETVSEEGWIRLRRFDSLYKTVETLGGLRETPKYCIIFMLDLIRSRLLMEADKLVAKGRLKHRNEVFNLKFEQLCAALESQSVDLNAAMSENRVFLDKLSRIPQLPAVIDSRGRILRPYIQPSADENCIVGTPISPGVYRGPVKCLHSASEKKLQVGDVLVARATDPGWTPLFVNAGAVILQVGGLLQHGALVAREYGLPCVGGISDVLDLWPDGTIVEVDGAAGTVRLIH